MFKFAFNYLRKNLKIIVLLLIFFAIFAFVFTLYNLPTESVFYASLLCAVIGIIFLMLDFLLKYNRHKKFISILEEICITLDNLPEAKSYIDMDYVNLLKELFNDKSKMATIHALNQKELMDYFTMWVHQVKTPIAAMKLLMEGNDSKEYNLLGSELFKVEQYVEMVLGYLRLESPANDYIIKEYDLDEIIRNSLRKYGKLFVLKKITLSFKETHEKVITDEKWLTFAVDQIISNAIKYTNKGNVNIYCENEKILVIEDTGIGIQEEDLPRIFEKGYTGFNGRIDRKSTGLGLYLCKTALDRLSHKIWVESEVDKGTVIRIDLSSFNIQFD